MRNRKPDYHMQRGERAFLNALPQWLRYVIAMVVVAVVAAAGWFVGRENPVPPWIERYLIPGLGWLGLLLIVIAVGDWIRRRIGTTSAKKDSNGELR